MNDSPTKILIVDDEKEFTDLMQLHLRRHGNVHLRVVNFSDQAIDVSRQFKPDIILLDVIMPGMDGGEVLQALESDPVLSTIPVIVVSALATNDETKMGNAEQTGGHPIVAKPVQIDRLVEKIEDLIGHSLKAH